MLRMKKFVYESGTFHYGERWIQTGKVESIEAVEVWEGDRQYPNNVMVRQ